jgi:D-arabinose 1-dehydrogenase-like Zn-dependent alcohol dehydrogenase
VIVRIGGAGVCRTDLHIVEGISKSRTSICPISWGTRTPAGGRAHRCLP